LNTLTGDFQLHRGFHSRHLPDDRDIIVYLPPGYRIESGRRYPVLYLHDGQNVFDTETAFLGQEWQADETAEALIRAREIEPLIMVGIYNTGLNRIDEYTPTRGAHREMGETGGKARQYAAMIIDDLKRFIDAEYRTLDGPENTGLGGSSLGGLVTLYIGLRHPEIFGKLAALSPSVWWRHGAILRMIRDNPAPDPHPKIWVDIGTAEGNRHTRDARLLRDLLCRKGWRIGVDLAYVEDQGAWHTEAAWASRMPGVLRFLFGSAK
jgi:predicted alpha/beta superfamily hydrolase